MTIEIKEEKKSQEEDMQPRGKGSDRNLLGFGFSIHVNIRETGSKEESIEI
jgi:hypothetical protein